MSILSDQYILHIIFYISWYLDSTQLQMERWQSQIKLKKLKSIIVSGIILMASLRGVFKLMLSSLPLIGWSFRYPIDLDHRQASFNLKGFLRDHKESNVIRWKNYELMQMKLKMVEKYLANNTSKDPNLPR